MTGGESELICGLKSSPIPASRYKTIEPGREAADPGRDEDEVPGRLGGANGGRAALDGVGVEFGLSGDGVLTRKFVDLERGIWPGRRSESDDGLREAGVGCALLSVIRLAIA